MLRKYPGLFFLIPVVAGILFSDLVRPTGWLFLFLCLISFVGGLVLLKRESARFSIILFALCLFFFSGFHYALKTYNFGSNHVARFISEKQSYHIYGEVADWPELKHNRTELTIAIDSLGNGTNFPVKGSILLKLSNTTTALQRGDNVEFWGTIYPVKSHHGPGGFDYGRYLRHKGIHGIVYLPTLLNVRVGKPGGKGIIAYVDLLREEISESLSQNLSEVAASLSAGFLIGETREIPPDIYRWFRDSGTLHLLAVSGSNVALVILFLIIILRPLALPRKRRALVLMGCVMLFALLSYGEPSVVRASLMAILILLANVFERRYNLNQIIASAAMLILLAAPTQLFNVGFQLSFVTAWGLIFVTPRAAKFFEAVNHKGWYRWLVLPFMISLIAQLFSMPLIALYFGKVPAISVIANLVIIPLVSIAVVGVLILLLLDFILPVLGAFFGSLLDSFMQIVLYFLSLFGEEQSVIVNTGDISVVAVILFYGLLVLAAFSMSSKLLRRVTVFATAIVISIALLSSMVSASFRSNDFCTVDIFNIPGGTAILIYQNQSQVPDLIISGLTRKPYPIDERIFSSAFDELGVEGLGQVFVMSSEYGAIDDIYRLCLSYQANSVIVDARLEKSFSDISRTLFEDFSTIKIESFPADNFNKSLLGYYPSKNLIELELDNSAILIANQNILSGENKVPLAKPSLVIYCGRSKIARSEIEDFIESQSMLEQLVCSRIEQKGAGSLPALEYEKIVTDIGQTGGCRIKLKNRTDSSFQVSLF